MFFSCGTFYSSVYAADTVKPFVWGEHISPDTITSGNVTIYINGWDADSGLKSITLPDGSVSTRPNVSYIATQNGFYTFVLEDNAGNRYSHTVQITNIDRNPPVLEQATLKQNQNGRFEVYIKANDQAGIGYIRLNTGTNLTYADSGNYYYINNLSTQPTSFTMADKLGNTSPSTNFIDLPTVQTTYDSASRSGKVTINGSGTLSYKIDFKSYTCPGKPCVANNVPNQSFITAVNSTGKLASIREVMTNFANTKIINFVLDGYRNQTDSKKLHFSWNKTVSSGQLVCDTPEGKQTFNVSGTGTVITGKNYQYSCVLKGTVSGKNVQSNRLPIPPNYNDDVFFVKSTDNMPVKKFPSSINVFVEKTPIGDFYIINAKARNSNDNSVPVSNLIGG